MRVRERERERVRVRNWRGRGNIGRCYKERLAVTYIVGTNIITVTPPHALSASLD